MRCFPCTPQGNGTKGPFSFAKENGPFGTPRERLRLAVQSLNDLCASGMRLPARGVAALALLYDLPLLLSSAVAQRVQRFKIKTANVRGQGVRPLAFLWGFQRGYSLWKENTPFAPAARRRHSPPRSARKNHPACKATHLYTNWCKGGLPCRRDGFSAHCAEGNAACGRREQRGYSLSKENTPFGTPRERQGVLPLDPAHWQFLS